MLEKIETSSFLGAADMFQNEKQMGEDDITTSRSVLYVKVKQHVLVYSPLALPACSANLVCHGSRPPTCPFSLLMTDHSSSGRGGVAFWMVGQFHRQKAFLKSLR